jgi:hypothetical protein
MKRAALVAFLLSVPSLAQADMLSAGTWVQRGDGKSSRFIMTVEVAGAGRRLTYRLLLPDGTTSKDPVLTVETQFDGKDAPVLLNGSPTGETMAVRRIDGNHTVTIIKFQGREFGISKAELSADGRVVRIENDFSETHGMSSAGKTIDYWDKR